MRTDSFCENISNDINNRICQGHSFKETKTRICTIFSDFLHLPSTITKLNIKINYLYHSKLLRKCLTNTTHEIRSQTNKSLCK
jgi:hypothetical protein